jgi:hypothetical protein
MYVHLQILRKKKCLLNQENRATGGGVKKVKDLTDHEERALAVMGVLPLTLIPRPPYAHHHMTAQRTLMTPSYTCDVNDSEGMGSASGTMDAALFKLLHNTMSLPTPTFMKHLKKRHVITDLGAENAEISYSDKLLDVELKKNVLRSKRSV